MVPPVVATAQAFPVVVTVYGNVPVTDGVPLIVNVVPVTLELTPVGNPVTVAPVAPPPNVIVIEVIALFTQTVLFAPAVIVCKGLTTTVLDVASGIVHPAGLVPPACVY